MFQELYRRVRAILNKLTPQKFQTLVKQCTNLEINTEERLKGSIDIIFEKVCLVFENTNIIKDIGTVDKMQQFN